MRLHVKIIMIFCSLVQLMQCANQSTKGPVLVAHQALCHHSISFTQFRRRCDLPQSGCPTKTLSPEDDPSSCGTNSDVTEDSFSGLLHALETKKSFNCLPTMPQSGSTNSLVEMGSPLIKQLSERLYATSPFDADTPEHYTNPPTPKQKRSKHSTISPTDGDTPEHYTNPPTPKQRRSKHPTTLPFDGGTPDHHTKPLRAFNRLKNSQNLSAIAFNYLKKTEERRANYLHQKQSRG